MSHPPLALRGTTRFLDENSLTGALPREWSALKSLKWM